MKVLITSGHLDRKGGIVNYVDQLIRNLKQNDIEVCHFVHGLKPKYHKNWLVPLAWVYQFGKFSIELDSENPDIVHINPSLNRGSIIRDFIFLKISKNKGFPVILFFRGWRWDLFKKIRSHLIFRKKFIKCLEEANQIVVLSKDFKDALIALGIEENKIEISSTMVETEKYKPEKKNFNRPYNILFCGNITKAKGVYELLRAIDRVVEKNKNFNFIFMGDGPELENLKIKSEEMSIEEHVTFTGYKTGEEKYKIYKKSHLFVFPTYHGEGFPNVALEAMAAGLPIITTKNAGLKRLIEDGKNGFFLSSMPSDPEEIAEKIIELIDNPDLMKEMSENNLLEAKSKYDVKAVTDDIVKIYKEICFDNN